MSEAVQVLIGAAQIGLLGGIFMRMGDHGARITALENMFKPKILEA